MLEISDNIMIKYFYCFLICKKLTVLKISHNTTVYCKMKYDRLIKKIKK